jgi:hypothetical protein
MFGWHFVAIRYIGSVDSTATVPGWRFSFVTFPLEDRKGPPVNYWDRCLRFDQQAGITPSEDFLIVYEHTDPEIGDLLHALLDNPAVVEEFKTAIAPFAGPSAPDFTKQWLLTFSPGSEPIHGKAYNGNQLERPVLHTCGGKVCTEHACAEYQVNHRCNERCPPPMW